MIESPNIKETLQKDLENAEILIADLKLIVKSEKEMIKYNLQFFDALVSKIVPHENIKQIKDQFTIFSKELRVLSEEQQNFIQLIEMKIYPSLSFYITEVKELYKSHSDYEKKLQIEQKYQQNYHALLGDLQQTSLQSSNQEKEELKKLYLQSKSHTNISGVNLSNKLRLYMSNRNGEFKAIMQNITNKQMTLHSKGLSISSKLVAYIHDINTEREGNLLLDTVIGSKQAEIILDEEKEKNEQKE